jgi:hypothetical protein
MTTHQDGPAQALADHLAECTGADAAVVADGNADDIVASLIAAGWTLDDGAEFIAGKRIRMMHPPPDRHIRKPDVPGEGGNGTG